MLSTPVTRVNQLRDGMASCFKHWHIPIIDGMPDYRNINADVVYEGELCGKDKLSGSIDLSGEKTSDRIEGFFAHFETVNGFSKTLYMSLAEMAAYALKYSPSFKRKPTKDDPIPTVDNLCDLANGQAQNGPTGKVDYRQLQQGQRLLAGG